MNAYQRIREAQRRNERDVLRYVRKFNKVGEGVLNTSRRGAAWTNAVYRLRDRGSIKYLYTATKSRGWWVVKTNKSIRKELALRVDPKINRARRLFLLNFPRLQFEAANLGLFITARAINNAIKAAGWEAAGDTAKAATYAPSFEGK